MDGYQNQNQNMNMNQQNAPQNSGYPNQNMGQMPPQTPPRNWDTPVLPMSFGQQVPPGGMPNWLQYMINSYLSQQQRQPDPRQFSGFGQSNQAQPQPQTMPQQQVQQETVTPQRATANAISLARVVTSPEEIRPSELPVDDTIRLFLQDDLSVIHGKKWNNRGTIDNMTFVRVDDTPERIEPQLAAVLEQTESDLNRRVSVMEDNVARLSEAIMEYLSRQNATTQPPVEIAKRPAQNKSTKKEG